MPLGFRIVAWLVIACVKLARWRIRTTGLEHIPRDGGAVITWNHHSHVDFVMTAYDVYRQVGRHVRIVAMRELWRHRGLGWVPRLADAVPVDRRSVGDRDRALKDAVAAARNGDLVLVAPEGTISESFDLLPWRTGAARIAQLADVPLIPSASWGSHRLVTTGHPFSLRRGWRLPVSVVFGEPIEVPADADVVRITETARDRTARMLEELQRSYPDGLPRGAWWVPRRLGGGAPPHDEILARHRKQRQERRRRAS